MVRRGRKDNKVSLLTWWSIAARAPDVYDPPPFVAPVTDSVPGAKVVDEQRHLILRDRLLWRRPARLRFVGGAFAGRALYAPIAVVVQILSRVMRNPPIHNRIP